MSINFLVTDLGLQVCISRQLLEEIKKAAKQCYPNEFGGVFVGYYDQSYCKAQIVQTIYPNDFQNSPVHFQRDTEDLNHYFRELYQKTDGKHIYLGEWHSHPNMNCFPRITDYAAIKSIAENPNVKISSPYSLLWEGRKIKWIIVCISIINQNYSL